MRHVLSLLAVLCTSIPPLAAQANPGAAPPRVLIHAGRLVDGLAAQPRTDQGILVEGERIAAVGPWAEVSARGSGARVIDLGGMTVLPGLIDAHTHVFLQGDITAAEYDDQLLKESIPYRTIRAVAAARRALEQGFTTIRDLETEGAMFADADLKRAIAAGVVPGPRMFVATRAFSATGMYPPLGYSWEIELPGGVQFVDGPDEIRRAVREQVKHGADWIKVYVDRRYYEAEDGRLRSWLNFDDEELAMFVREAHRLGRRIAAHAMGWDGIDAALRHGFDSIEHGYGFTPDLLDRAARQGTWWCPTLHVGRYVAEGRGGVWRAMPARVSKAVGEGVRRGVRIANGSDAGGFAWTEPMAIELAWLVEAGMTPMQAIQAATTRAAELLDQSANLGAVAPGRYADIIAVAGDPLADIAALRQPAFVMKGGAVVAQPGVAPGR